MKKLGIIFFIFILGISAAYADNERRLSPQEVREHLQVAKEALLNLQEAYESGEKVVVAHENVHKFVIGAKTVLKYATIAEVALVTIAGTSFAYAIALDSKGIGAISVPINVGVYAAWALVPTSIFYLWMKGAEYMSKDKVTITQEEREALLAEIKTRLEEIESLDAQLR
ncbi:MAG: hypothetical protein AB7F43_12740 [Bacteriovoracia bacterium]